MKNFYNRLCRLAFFYSREGIRLLFYLFLLGKRLFWRMGLFLMYDVRGIITMVHILHMKNINKFYFILGAGTSQNGVGLTLASKFLFFSLIIVKSEIIIFCNFLLATIWVIKLILDWPCYIFLASFSVWNIQKNGDDKNKIVFEVLFSQNGRWKSFFIWNWKVQKD